MIGVFSREAVIAEPLIKSLKGILADTANRLDVIRSDLNPLAELHAFRKGSGVDRLAHEQAAKRIVAGLRHEQELR